MHLPSDRLPRPLSSCLAPAGGVVLPVQRSIARDVALAEEDGSEVDAVELGVGGSAGESKDRRHEIPRRDHLLGHGVRRDRTRLGHDQRNADAPLVQIALVAAETAGAFEERGVVAPQLERRSIVARQNDDGLLENPFTRERVDEASDVPVEPGHHRRVGRPRRLVRKVALPPLVRRLFPTTPIRIERVIRHLQREVRDRRGIHEEEGTISVRRDERLAPLDHRIGRVDCAGESTRIPVEKQFVAILDEVGRIEVVGVPLAQIPDEPVEAVIARKTPGPRTAQSPLACEIGRIAPALQRRREGLRSDRHARLSAPPRIVRIRHGPRVKHLGRGILGIAGQIRRFEIVSDGGPPGMSAGQQDAPTGRAHGRSRIGVFEEHPTRP